jgi:Bacterial Ig domain/Calx-beta domain
MKFQLCRRHLHLFTVCLVTFSMLTMPFVPMTVSLARAAERQGPSVGRHKSKTLAPETQHYSVNPNAPVPAPAPAPFAPSITATKAAVLINDDGDNKADPATSPNPEKIEYTVTISNNGTTDATNVIFNDTLDTHTMLVDGSVNTQPIADPDTYTASGNIQISIAAPGVLTNDRDPDTGNNTGLTVTKVQGVGANVGVATDTTKAGVGGVKGSVTLNANGSFTYEPPPGYEGTGANADSFTYEISDGTKTDTATVTIDITGMVWFISNNAGGLNRGTFTNPFTTIASFNTVSNAGGGVAPNPKNGDFVSLRLGTGTYTETDGVNLRAQQKLIGNAIQFNTVFTASANSSSAYTTFASTTTAAPNIVTTAGNGIDLATDNTVRGLNVGNTPGFFKFNGTAVGSPVINTVNLTGTGGALNVSTSGAFGANVLFGTFESTSSPGANLNLVGVTGTLGITSPGTGLSGSNAASAAVNVSGGSVSFTYTGNVSKTNAGALVSVSGGHGTGTITFNTGTLSATLGTGLQFDNADGTYNFNGTNTLNGGDAGIDILNGSSGNFSFSASSTITSPSGTAFNVASSPGNPNVTYSGSITDNTAGQRAVNIDGTTGGAISIATVTTASTAGGVGNTGININSANGNVTFTTLTMGTSGTRHTAQPVTITGGTGTYGLGTVNIFTNNVTGIGATNADGTLNSTAGTIDTNGGTTVNIDGPAGLTTLGMTLTKLFSNTGTATGLIIQDTNGSFTVTGSGGACTSSVTCTGGSLSNKTGTGLGGSGTDGAFLKNVTNISLTRMNISDSNGNGVFGGNVNGFRLDNCLLNSNADAGTGADYMALGFNNETNVHLVNVSGTAFGGANPTGITNSTITNAFEHDVEIDQTTGTLTDFQINNSTINNNGASSQAANRVLYIMNGGPGVTGTLTVQDSFLTGNRTVGALTAQGIQATVSAGTQNVKVFRNLLQNHFSAVDVSTSTAGILNFDIRDNGGSGGVANNGASNGRIIGSDSVAINVFTNANSTGSVNGFIQGNTVGIQGVAASGSVVGRGMQFQNEGSINSKVLISGNIVQGVAGNQELNIQHGIAVAGAAGRSDVTAINNTLRENTSTTRPLNAEILNTGTLCVDIAGNTFANNIGQGGGPSLLRVNDPAGTGTMLVRQLTPTGAVDPNQLDDANGLTNAQVTVSGAPTFNGGACNQPTTFGPIISSNFVPQRFDRKTDGNDRQVLSARLEPNSTQLPQPSFLARAASALVAFASEVHSLIEPSAQASSEAPRVESAPPTSVSLAQPARVSTKPVASNVQGQKLLVKPADNRSRKVLSNHAKLRNPRYLAAAPMAGGTVGPINIGTLRPGDSVTITFQATVNNPPNLTGVPPGTPQVSNTGTVTFTEPGSPVNTNTVNTSNFGDLVTFTATVAESPAQPSVDPTGTVDFIDTSNGNAVVCDDVTLTAGSAQCQTSTLTAGTHNIRADYSGDGNFDPSQSNIVAQVVIACAADPIVTSTADGGAGTLREALANVCTGDTITFDLAGPGPHTITLTTGELVVARDVTIKNTSGESITVSGNNASRVFNINSGKTAAIIGLNISGGNASGGGAIINDGALTVVNSALFSNTSTADGGAISTTATGTVLNLINTTVSGNSATGSGGGVVVLGGTATSINSTITNNTADSDNNSTGTGGGISAQAGTTTLKNTIVAGNFNEDGGSDAADDISGTVDTTANASFNLIGTGGAGGLTNGVNNNQVGVASPGLGVLANNGGTTQTHALSPTSPAVETGGNANVPADAFDLDGDANTGETLPVDQRGLGFPRVADSSDADTTQTVDIGAFELHPSIEDIPNQSTNEDTVKNVMFNLGDDTGSLIAMVTGTSSNTTLVPNANLMFSGSGGSRTLQITPAANQSGTTTITVTVTATNGRTATDSFDLTVNAANDPPAGTDNTVSTAEDTAYTFTAADFGFTDPNDSPPNTLLAVKITTLPGLGTLTNNNVAVNAGDFIPVADINGGLLKFTPAADGNGSPYTTFTFQVQDNGGGTDLDPTPNTMTINVTAVNDAPVNTVPGPQSTTEDTAKVFSSGNANQISVADVDAGSNPIKITLTATNGTLTLSTTAGLVFITGDGTDDATMMFTGTLTAVNTALNGMSFNPTGDFTGAASLQIVSDDQGNTGAGGPLTDTDTVNITVNAANDAPVVTTTAGNLSYTENDPATAIDPGLTVTDIDSANLVGATVAITSGFVSAQDTLAFTNQLGITGNYNSGTGVLTLTGTTTVANYQTALRAVTYQNSSDNPTASRTVSFVADDGSSTGSNTRGITINAVNDAPVNTVPGPQGTNQNTPLVFSSGNGNQISVADVDAGTNAVQVTLTATNGTLTLSGTAGLAFTVGDGTADTTMTFTGTIANINTALNGMSFTPTMGFTGAATLTITTNDLGNTGSGGPLSDTDVVNIQVATNVSIQDAQVGEPDSGQVNMVFTVTLSAPAPGGGASVDFTTQQQAPAVNHATAGSDYTTTSGTVSFAAGEQFKTILVPVLSDNNNAEANETFLVVLSNPVNATIADGTATGTIIENEQAGTILISELRTSGPAGAGDDFVEIYNNSSAAHTVNGTGGGYGLFKMGASCSGTPVLIGVIPNGTVIPGRGHFLFTGSAYSLADYGGTGNAAGDVTLSQDIENDRNVAIFSTATLGGISSANRLDAVGFGGNTGGTCDLFREGTTLTPLSGSTLEYSYFRDECGKKGNPSTFGPCPTTGLTKDSNVNGDDFIFVDTNATATPAGQRLGAPGPQNLGSPRTSFDVLVLLLDSTKGAAATPNRVRDTSAIGPNAAQGTMTIRRRFQNNTGGPVTRLRIRVVDISTTFVPGGVADLRMLTSGNVTVSVSDPATCTAAGFPSTPCNIVVGGTTLETPPAQPMGGGFNSSVTTGTITLGTPLAPGASVNLQLLLGVQSSGSFKFFFNIEALP